MGRKRNDEIAGIYKVPKVNKIVQSFNRIDQDKYKFGCRTMENFIPLIYGGAQRRPGTEYIAGCKSNSAKSRLIAFEHSVDDTYILEFANQIIRVFKSGAQVLDSVGTEDLSSLDYIIAHWLLNETGDTAVADDEGGTHDGTATVDIGTITATGKVGSGCFDLGGQYTVEIADHNDFSFTDNADDSAFSIVCWAYVTQQGSLQVLLSKWQDESTAKEWRFSLSNERKLQLHLADTSANLEANRVAQWKLNDTDADKVVDDAVGVVPHTGALTPSNCADITTTGKIGACFDFGGAEAVEITDHAALSFGDGASDSAFSIAAWIYVTNTGATQMIFSKWDTNAKGEYRLSLTAEEKLSFDIWDESQSKGAKKTTDTALTTGWHLVVATYDGTGGNTADTGMTLYVDGVAVAATGSTTAGYVAMENLAAKVAIGAYYIGGALSLNFADKIDNVVLFNIELSQANVTTLWNDGNGTETTISLVISSVTDDSISLGWHLLACTYSAPSDETVAADGIILYVDGAAVDSTAINDANYTAMQNGAEEIRIGSQRNSGDTANEKFWADKIDEVSVFSDVLTPTEIASLYTTEVYEITAPYLTADLFDLKYEHSADVLFITHPDYEPRKLSRLGDTLWTLEVLGIEDGPFRAENTDTSATIVADGTTGTVTLTAVGCDPFAMGTTAGHEPSGSAATSKSQTGALFRLVQGLATSYKSGLIGVEVLNAASGTLTVSKGVTWDLVTNGTWGSAANSATVVLERSYDSGTTYETVVSFTSAANYNIKTSGTEEFADAIYRLRVDEAGADSDMAYNLSVRDEGHIGIVKITSVASSTSAIGTVLTTLASTDLTHRWSEGAWSNYRGWPVAVSISPEERLTLAGSVSKPLTVWGSAIGDFTSFKIGTFDDDAIIFTIVGSGRQNRIRWIVPKTALAIGTVGGEHILGGSSENEALTPTNVQANLQTSHGSADVQAVRIGQAILFLQRGRKKIREMIYHYDTDSHKADDLTVFASHITESGIVDMDFLRTPEPMLWCVRDDGEIAIMSYEKDQNVFAWSRLVTSDNTGDSDFESCAIIYGGSGNEDEVWVTVRRTVGGSDVRYVERFKPRDWGSTLADAFFVDCGITDTGGTTTVSGLDHLEGEEVQVFGDGAKQTEGTAGDFTVTSGDITVPSGLSKVQAGLAYTSTLKPMKLDLGGLGLATTKKITKAIISLYKTMGGEAGTSTATNDIDSLVYLDEGDTGTEFPLTTNDIEMTIPSGYERAGDIIIRQTDPLPMTVLALTLDLGAAND
jgi:hypothetical protein